MREYQQKKKIKKLAKSKITLAVLALFCALLLSSSYDLFQKKKQVLKRKAEAEYELNIAEKKKAEIGKELDKLSSVRGEERLIREKFNVKKEGEQVIVVMSKDNKGDDNKIIKLDLISRIKLFFQNIFN